MKKCADGYFRKSFSYEGKQYTVTGKTEDEVFEKKAKLKLELENGLRSVNKNSTVKQWAEEWLATYKAGNMTDKSFLTYRQKLDRHILPAIGHMKLKDVKDVHLQKILNSQRGMSLSHLAKLRMVMNQMFSRAVKSRLIVWNPADDLVLPDPQKNIRRSITPAERKAILEVAETHVAGLWVKTILYCGLRPGETIPLQWKDIDFKTKTVHVRSALESGSTCSFKVPKTAAGIRDIPIPSALLNDLQKAHGGPFEFVFTQQLAANQKKHHTESSLRSYWKSFKRALDIHMGATVYRNQIIESKVAKDLTPYCLRHTYCTDLQDAGVPLNVAKYLMGHDDVSVTANIYTHTTSDAIHSAVQSIDNYQKKKKMTSGPV